MLMFARVFIWFGVSSYNHDGDKISHGYMAFSCGRNDGSSGTVDFNVSMQLIMILDLFQAEFFRFNFGQQTSSSHFIIYCDVCSKIRSISELQIVTMAKCVHGEYSSVFSTCRCIFLHSNIPYAISIIND